MTEEKDANVRKFIVVQNLQSDDTEIVFKVDKDGKNMIEDLCHELEYECEEYEKDGVYSVKIKKSTEVKGSVSDATDFLVPLPPKSVNEKILNPAILTLFIPQIKAVSSIRERIYLLRIKWVISWDTPLTVYSVKLDDNRYIARYYASQKIPLFVVSFGFDFYIMSEGTGSRIKMKEWYKGPFKQLAKGEIEKHLKKAKEVLPEFLIKI